MGEKALHFALYFLGWACIIVSLAKATSMTIKYLKKKDRLKVTNYPALVIEYVHKDIVNEIKKVWK